MAAAALHVSQSLLLIRAREVPPATGLVVIRFARACRHGSALSMFFSDVPYSASYPATKFSCGQHEKDITCLAVCGLGAWRFFMLELHRVRGRGEVLWTHEVENQGGGVEVGSAGRGGGEGGG